MKKAGSRKGRTTSNDKYDSSSVETQKPSFSEFEEMLVLTGEARQNWYNAYMEIERAFAGAIEYEPPRVTNSDLKNLIESIDLLIRAIKPFGEPPACELPVSLFGLGIDLIGLQDWAKEKLEKNSLGGRPRNHVIHAVVRDLLRLYHIGFDRRPSRSPSGPTVRFLFYFFSCFKGQKLEFLEPDEIGNAIVYETLLIPAPPLEAIPDLIRQNLDKALTQPPGFYWDHFKLPRLPGWESKRAVE